MKIATRQEARPPELDTFAAAFAVAGDPGFAKNAVSNPTRKLIHEVQLRYIFQQGLHDFQKCFIDSTAVEANTDRSTDSTILVRLIARICTTGGNLHRFNLPDMNQIGLLEQQEELRHLSAASFPQWQSARRSQAQEGVFSLTAARAQATQTPAARSRVGSPELGGPHRSASESASDGTRSPVPYR